MVCKITWLPRALSTYIANIEYLQANWTEQEIENFKKFVDQKLKNLAHHPRLGRSMNSSAPNIRLTLIHQRVALIYKYKVSTDEIELLVFWNTSRNPSKRRL